MALVSNQTPPINPQTSGANASGFAFDLESLGGNLVGSVFEGINTYVNRRATLEAEKSAQPEKQREAEPTKGVNEKGQTLIVGNTSEDDKNKTGFTVEPKHIAVGGSLFALGLLGYIAFGKKKG